MTSHDQPGPPTGIDTSTPNPARIYDALLGGKDNFPADRTAAHAILNIAPQARRGAKQNRAFLQRAVRFLAREASIRQFLDIGTGLPTKATSTRSPSRSRRMPGSSTSTTTPWSMRTPTRC